MKTYNRSWSGKVCRKSCQNIKVKKKQVPKKKDIDR